MILRRTHAFTVDVEEWFHLHSADMGSPADWRDYESRVVRQTDHVLDLLAEYGVRATFFVLGWVADREPALVRRIRDQGHEIGCHSYYHPLVSEMSPDAFEADLQRALEAIESAAGVRPTGYRAPSFSVTERDEWFFEVLARNGIAWDSSICPASRHDSERSDFDESPAPIDTPAGRVWELPVTTFRWGPLSAGSLGGGYFRLLPVDTVARQFGRRETAGERGIFYLHPHDLDPGIPRVYLGPAASFRKYVGLGRATGKLRDLLGRVTFDALGGPSVSR